VNVWRSNPIPTQLSVGVAVLLASAASSFLPQAYPVHLMGVAGARASSIPFQQKGFEAQLLPQAATPAVPLRPDAQAMAVAAFRNASVPTQAVPFNPALVPGAQFDPSLFVGPAWAQRAAVAFYKPPTMPFWPYPTQPDFLDLYEADGAIGRDITQEVIAAGQRAPAIPIQAQPFNPALIAQAQSTYLPQQPYPYAALKAAAQAWPMAWGGYNPAIDGPYQAPPLAIQQPFQARLGAPPAQASNFNPALFPAAQADPPLGQAYPYAALLKPQVWPTQAPANINPALTLPPDAPPLVPFPPLAGMQWRQAPLPWQNPTALNPALYPPPPVNPPPLVPPYPYASIERFPRLPAQAPLIYNPAIDAPPPPVVVPAFPDSSGGFRKKPRPFHSIYMPQERANNDPLQEVVKEALKEVAEAVSAPIAEPAEQAEADEATEPILEVLREAIATPAEVEPAEPPKPELTAAQKLDAAIAQYFTEHKDEADDEDAIAALYALLSALDSPGTAHA
jgi:hypothetical protein